MSEELAPAPTIQAAWEIDLATAFCGHCHTSYLVHRDAPPGKCPLCWRAALEITPDSPIRTPFPCPPELILPARLTEAQLLEAIRSFTTGIPFAPPELNPAVLHARLSTVYLPMWLVDALVSAYWQAEAGFDYQVISHRESFNLNLGGWKSSKVEEARVRWENRVGRINRVYQNVTTPALEDAALLEQKIGRFQLDSAQSYSPDCIRQAFIRMPDRTPQTSWGEAAAAFQKTAADDCRRACAAGRIRHFRWKARFTRLNWTLMLLPVYSTWYQDDHGQTQTILIHGQTGAISGARRASGRRAGRTGLIILVAAVLLFLAGLLLGAVPAGNPSLATIAILLVVLGAAGILAASIPYIIAWDFNHRQILDDMKS